jgi:hypothetical protein
VKILKFSLSFFLLFVFVLPVFNSFDISAATVSYKFPWKNGDSKTWWRASDPWHGGHDINCVNQTGNPAMCAIDFGGSGAWEVLAMASGKVNVICDDKPTKTVNVEITDANGIKVRYFHINKTTLNSTKVKDGATIQQGQLLGNVWTGNLTSDCEKAVAQQTATSGHVHIIIPTAPFVIDGWTFDYPSKCAKKSSVTKCAGNQFTSTNSSVNGNQSTDNYGIIYGANWNILPPADVNGDGRADLIAYHKKTTKVNVTLSTGTNFGGGNLGSKTWNTNSGYDEANWIILPPADVNGDKKADLIAYHKTSTKVDVTLSTGTNFGGGNLGYQVWNANSGYDMANWNLLAPADVNGDGKSDLIAYHKTSTKIDATLSTGTNFGGGNLGFQVWNNNSGYDLTNWMLLDPADVNGDKKADLIAYHKTSTKVDVTLSTGTNFGGGNLGFQVWNANTGYDLTNWNLLAPADVNKDGRADLIAYHKKTSKVDVTLSTVNNNFGGGNLGYKVWNTNTGYDEANWILMPPADVNRDGRVDLIAYHKNSTKVDVTLSTGTNFGGGSLGYQVWNSNTGYD